MPDKQNENKFMAMLERKGIVRKSDEADESVQAGSGTTRPRPESDLRSMFGTPESRPQNVTPASRQPVPGMINPVVPSQTEQPTSDESIQPRPAERVVPLQRPIQASEDAQWQRPVQAPEDTQWQRPAQAPEDAQWQRPYEPEQPMPTPTMQIDFEPQTTDSAMSAPYYTAVNPFKEETEETMSSAPMADAPYYENPAQVQSQQPSPDGSIIERYLEIDELYDALNVKPKRTDTIYLVEEYLQTLPDSLPEESRRAIVGKIVAASGFDYDLLMGDGVLRVKMLKEYAARFAQHTEDYVSNRNAELEELGRQIDMVRTLIEKRRELHKKQFFTIEAEANRLKEILTFISG